MQNSATINHNVKKIIIHAGIHKTGSSSIQDTLYANREYLSAVHGGIFYSEKWMRNHSIPLYSLFCDTPEKYHNHIKEQYSKNKVLRLNKKWKNEILSELEETTCQTIIFSGEDISVLEKHEIEKFKNFLKKILPDAQIRIILFTRDLCSLYPSWKQQRIRGGLMKTLGIDNTLYQSILQRFIAVFGKMNVDVFSFEEACENFHGPVGFFLEIIGLSEEETERIEIKKSNVGISDSATELILYINETMPVLDNGEMRRGRDPFDCAPLFEIRGNKYQLEPEDVCRMKNNNNADELWLRKEFGIDYTSLQPCMPKAEITYDVNYYNDVIKSLQNSSVVIKYLVCQFLTEKISQDENEFPFLEKLVNLLNTEYPFLRAGNVDNILFRYKIEKLKTAIHKFKNTTKEKIRKLMFLPGL